MDAVTFEIHANTFFSEAKRRFIDRVGNLHPLAITTDVYQMAYWLVQAETALKKYYLDATLVPENDRIKVITNRRITQAESTLLNKSVEYSTADDRLYNFKRAGSLLVCSPERALLGMASKHFVSCCDLYDRIRYGDEAMLDEKFGDAFNYCVLLYALMNEKQ